MPSGSATPDSGSPALEAERRVDGDTDGDADDPSGDDDAEGEERASEAGVGSRCWGRSARLLR